MVSSQQQDPVRGLRDNRSTEGVQMEQRQAGKGIMSNEETRRSEAPRLANDLLARRFI